MTLKLRMDCCVAIYRLCWSNTVVMQCSSSPVAPIMVTTMVPGLTKHRNRPCILTPVLTYVIPNYLGCVSCTTVSNTTLVSLHVLPAPTALEGPCDLHIAVAGLVVESYNPSILFSMQRSRNYCNYCAQNSPCSPKRLQHTTIA